MILLKKILLEILSLMSSNYIRLSSQSYWRSFAEVKMRIQIMKLQDTLKMLMFMNSNLYNVIIKQQYKWRSINVCMRSWLQYMFWDELHEQVLNIVLLYVYLLSWKGVETIRLWTVYSINSMPSHTATLRLMKIISTGTKRDWQSFNRAAILQWTKEKLIWINELLYFRNDFATNQ